MMDKVLLKKYIKRFIILLIIIKLIIDCCNKHKKEPMTNTLSEEKYLFVDPGTLEEDGGPTQVFIAGFIVRDDRRGMLHRSAHYITYKQDCTTVEQGDSAPHCLYKSKGFDEEVLTGHVCYHEKRTPKGIFDLYRLNDFNDEKVYRLINLYTQEALMINTKSEKKDGKVYSYPVNSICAGGKGSDMVIIDTVGIMPFNDGTYAIYFKINDNKYYINKCESTYCKEMGGYPLLCWTQDVEDAVLFKFVKSRVPDSLSPEARVKYVAENSEDSEE